MPTNNGGAITGQWCDATYTLRPGFVRRSEGNIVPFDVPGEVFGVYPFVMSPQGAVVGTFYDGNFADHGFLYSPNGNVITIDVPGAGGTQAFAINANGTITGFDVPGSTTLSCSFDYGFFGTGVLEGMNPAGAITGAYFQPINGEFCFCDLGFGFVAQILASALIVVNPL